MELDKLNKQLFGQYETGGQKTLKDKVKDAKNAYGGPKYPELQDGYIPTMLDHYGVSADDGATLEARTLGMEHDLMPVSSNTNVNVERPDSLLTRDELDILR